MQQAKQLESILPFILDDLSCYPQFAQHLALHPTLNVHFGPKLMKGFIEHYKNYQDDDVKVAALTALAQLSPEVREKLLDVVDNKVHESYNKVELSLALLAALLQHTPIEELQGRNKLLALKRSMRERSITNNACEADDTSNPDIHVPNRTPKKGFANYAGKRSMEMEEIVTMIKDRRKYYAMGVYMPHGVLLKGAPGVGKTHAARSIAEELSIPFKAICATDVIYSKVGQTEKNIRALFDDAYAMAESSEGRVAIIFIDEFDGVGSRKNVSSSFEQKMITQFLNEMDGFEKRPDVDIIVIGATNHPESIDPAFKRPGRFERIVAVDTPDFEARCHLLRHFLDTVRHDTTSVNVEKIAELTEYKTPAELKKIVNEAANLAVRRKEDCLRQEHLEEVVNAMM